MADMPHDYFVVFGCFICTFFSVILPYSVSRQIIYKLASAILKQDQQDFLVNEYMPELHEATKHLKITFEEKLSIFKKFLGTIMKILFAFAY